MHLSACDARDEYDDAGKARRCDAMRGGAIENFSGLHHANDRDRKEETVCDRILMDY